MKKKFDFYTEYHLVKFTGIRANNINEFREAIKIVPGASIFYHMHHSHFRRHQTTVNFLNDCAQWLKDDMNERKLSEKIANINPFNFPTVRDTRAEILKILNDAIGTTEHFYTAAPEKAFLFCELQSFVFSLELSAKNLKEFYVNLQKVGMNCIFYHLIEARLKNKNMDNDFSYWIENSLYNRELAESIRKIPLSCLTIWNIKKKILNNIEQYL